MTPRLKLAMEHDGPSRGRYVRDVVQQLVKLRWLRGALLVTPDGFVIAAEVPSSMPVEPLAALAARLGGELEASATRMGRASFSTAMFSADDGVMFVAAAPIGYVVVLADQGANLEVIRTAVEEAVTLIQAAWTPPEETASAG